MRSTITAALTSLILISTLAAACSQPDNPATQQPRPSLVPTYTPTGTLDESPENVRPPSTQKYCWSTSGVIQGPAGPPTPFLYQPFSGAMSGNVWAAQLDHDQPNYRQDGRIATLGEILRCDTYGAGLAGGTEAYRVRQGNRYFPHDVPYTSILDLGYRVLAYQSPSFETYIDYDGHDGHDFSVRGNALAAADGKVAFMGDYDNALGRVIEIYHPQGYLTRYAHLASFEDELNVGTTVKAGDPIGVIGGSAVARGVIDDDYWGTHLHFSVFRWDQERNSWQITDPFGWDPWAGPDRAARERKQRGDPLIYCNGEISYDLWVGYWPQPTEHQAEADFVQPTEDRYVGGWLGEDRTETPTVLPTFPPTATPLLATASPQPAATIFTVYETDSYVYHIAISGNIVAWKGYDLMGCGAPTLVDVSTRDTIDVAGTWPACGSYAVSDRYFVAAGEREAPGIHIHDLATGAELPPIAVPGEYSSLAVDGNIVVWADRRQGNWDIYAKDLMADKEFVVTDAAGDQESPAISGNIVVWMDSRNGESDIFGKDIATNKEFMVSVEPSAETHPRISGNMVIWFDEPSYRFANIRGKDLTTGGFFEVVGDRSADPTKGLGTDGGWVTYASFELAQGWSIFARDISSGSAYRIAGPSLSCEPAGPAISQGVVVWGCKYGGDGGPFGWHAPIP